ncbi:MAG: hypothetical protein ACR2N9_00225, partial [Acidimicrobiia bacterium]
MAPVTRVLTVGSIPPEWGGPVAGGVATVHRGVLDSILADPNFRLTGVVPTKVVDRHPVPQGVRLIEHPSEDEYVDVANRADVILMNHVGHRYADFTEAVEATPTIAIVHSWT